MFNFHSSKVIVIMFIYVFCIFKESLIEYVIGDSI